ncbi:MAG: hypothetical protein R6U39_02555 [Candidatus Aegiribacteria sp.]
MLVLVIFIMVVSVAVKYVQMTAITPGRVSGELDRVYDRVSDVRPMSLLKAQFLMEWGRHRNSEECSAAVAASREYPGNGFEGDVYVVTYADSIEFPGFLPTLTRQFRVTKRLGG